VKFQAVEQLNLADNLSSDCVKMLDAVHEMIKKLTGANVEHAALIANSKILTLFSRFTIHISLFSKSLYSYRYIGVVFQEI